jgi:hypothetical protein
MGAAIHNASNGRAPVLIFAGLSPYTIEVEMAGPLKQIMPVFYINAEARYRVDSHTALSQVVAYLKSSPDMVERLADAKFEQRREKLKGSHRELHRSLDVKAEVAGPGSMSAAYVCSVLRKTLPKDSIFVIEAVTNSVIAAEQIRPTLPGQWINCGGGGLGWSGGTALIIKLAIEAAEGELDLAKKTHDCPNSGRWKLFVQCSSERVLDLASIQHSHSYSGLEQQR